jgi:LmbE family N-acetylglucosaminyl deacetylase
MKTARCGGITQQLCRNALRLASKEIPASELKRSAIVFSPHPDDESLGCGGIIIKKKSLGASVKIVHMTDGSAANHNNLISRQELRDIRMLESVRAAAVLGIDSSDIYQLEFPDSRLSEFTSEAVGKIADILNAERPEEIFLPSSREPSRNAVDHPATANVVLEALRLAQRSVTVREYPIWFWLHWPWIQLRQGARAVIGTGSVAKNSLDAAFGVRVFSELRYSVYIGDVLERKRAALSEHKSQMERIISDPRWITLGDISNGQFLDCFDQDYEYFRCYRINAKAGPRSKSDA